MYELRLPPNAVCELLTQDRARLGAEQAALRSALETLHSPEELDLMLSRARKLASVDHPSVPVTVLAVFRWPRV